MVLTNNVKNGGDQKEKLFEAERVHKKHHSILFSSREI